MADQQGLFDCPICLHLLHDPVTTTCGHSYCKGCINSVWDDNIKQNRDCRCPQCRQTFTTRPDLKRNTLLAELLDNNKKGDDTGGHYAEPGDVECDACMGRKHQAVKFCLVCLASYCETHVKPHFEVPPLRKHQLVPASKNICESICCHHDKLLELFCHSDQQFICLLCAVGEHKGHCTALIESEKREKQRALEETKQNILHRTLKLEEEMKTVRQAEDYIRDAAWESVDDFERLCMENGRLYVLSMEKKCSEMREKVGDMEKAAVDRTNDLLGQLRLELSDLRRGDAELDSLSLLENPLQFIKGCLSFSEPPVSSNSLQSLDTVKAFVSAQKTDLENMCKEEKLKVSCTFEQNMLSKPAETFLTETIKAKRYNLATSRKQKLKVDPNKVLKVDPNTVPVYLSLSDQNSEISWTASDRPHPDHPERFTFYHQVLCDRGLTEDSYWEAEWDGGIVEVAVSYRGIERKGPQNNCCFGHNSLSWSLVCSPFGCTFWHNNIHKSKIPPPCSPRVGVYLEFSAGRVSFFSVSNSGELTLLHKMKTIFTEPVYPGFCVDLGATLKICQP